MLSAEERAVIKEAQSGKAEQAYALMATLQLSEARKLWLTGAIQLHLAKSAAEKAVAAQTLRGALAHPWATPQSKMFALLDLSSIALELNDWGLWQEMRAVADECEENHMDVEHVSAALAGFWLNYGMHMGMERRHDGAIAAFEKVIKDRTPGNWCFRVSALNQMVRQFALKGEARPDLLDAALAEVPPERTGAYSGQAMLSRAYLLRLQGRLAEAKLLANDASRQAQAEKDVFETVLVDLFLVRLAVAREENADAEVLARLQRNGQRYPFGPFLAAKILKEREVKTCVSVS